MPVEQKMCIFIWIRVPKLSAHYTFKSAMFYSSDCVISLLLAPWDLWTAAKGQLPPPQDSFAASQETLLWADLTEVNKNLLIDFREVVDQCLLPLHIWEKGSVGHPPSLHAQLLQTFTSAR